MALKFTINDLVEVPGPLRDLYTKTADGKFILAVEGHPDAAKLSEFRNNNLALLREVEELRPLKTKFEGIDPEAVKADRLKLTELEKTKPEESRRLTELEAELAAEKTARASAQGKADRGLLRDTLRSKALAAGVLPAALDICLDKAEPVFAVVNETVQARPNTFSKSRPGEPLSIDEWLTGAMKEFSFLFAASVGGGADPKRGGGAGGAKELRNPSPAQLGEHAKAISRGELKVVYD